MRELEWTHDCQGKMDYDGTLVYVTSRTYPRFYHAGDGPHHGKTLATGSSTFMIGYTEVLSKEFHAETQEEVNAAITVWVREHLGKIEAAVRSALTD